MTGDIPLIFIVLEATLYPVHQFKSLYHSLNNRDLFAFSDANR